MAIINLQLNTKNVEYSLNISKEYKHPENYFCSGDDEADKKAVDSIWKELESGNEYAWFNAEVTASIGDITGYPVYLGCCSYKDREDFIKGEYFRDMKEEALGNLVEALTVALS